MISVEQAHELIAQHTPDGVPVRRAVIDSVGLVLAEDVAADIDSPPHDKALVDGYAVRTEDLSEDAVELQVIEEVTAGQVPTKPLGEGEATRIMTGAPVPNGANAVVMVENTEAVEPSGVRITNTKLPPGGFIMPRSTSHAAGDVVVNAGTIIRPIEVGALSEVGRVEVDVFQPPTLAVMTSGNELVDVDQIPAAGQIRNSNNPMLTALARTAGADAVDLGVARDEEDAIRRLVQEGLQRDILVLSGGVSAGVLDLVPKVLADAGVEQIFHKVNLKPGKPLWFGVGPVRRTGPAAGTNPNATHNQPQVQSGRLDLPGTLVFGLPGNPVSSLVCFELFVRPTIARMRGTSDGGLKSVRGELTQPFRHRGDRPTYHPAFLTDASNGLPRISLADWKGSADLSSVSGANALAVFPSGEYELTTAEEIEVLLFA